MLLPTKLNLMEPEQDLLVWYLCLSACACSVHLFDDFVFKSTHVRGLLRKCDLHASWHDLIYVFTVFVFKSGQSLGAVLIDVIESHIGKISKQWIVKILCNLHWQPFSCMHALVHETYIKMKRKLR